MDGSVNPEKAKVLDAIFDNIRYTLLAEMKMSMHRSGLNINRETQFLLPLVRRVFTKLMVNDIVDVNIVAKAGAIKTEKFNVEWDIETNEIDNITENSSEKQFEYSIKVIETIADEISNELNYEIINVLKKAVSPKVTYKMDYRAFGNASTEDAKIPEKTLTRMILSEAKKNKGNRVIISPTLYVVLQAEGFPKVEITNRFCYVGRLEGLSVYVDQYSSDISPAIICRKDIHKKVRLIAVEV